MELWTLRQTRAAPLPRSRLESLDVSPAIPWIAFILFLLCLFFFFFEPAVPILGWLSAGTQGWSSPAKLDDPKESLSPTFPMRILRRESPSWPRALLRLDLNPKGRVLVISNSHFLLHQDPLQAQEC